MAINYDKYLKRLRAKRADNPEYAFYRQTMQSMTEPLKQINNTMQGQMNLAGGSSGARAQAGLNSQMALQGMAGNLYGQADRSGIARNDQIEMQRDQEQQAGKDAGLKSALNIGGTILGGAAGAIIGSAAGGVGAIPGAMYGAGIGGGLGNIAGGFVGGGGDMGWKYADEQQITQGMMDVAGGLSSFSTLKDQKKLFGEVGEFMSGLPADMSLTDWERMKFVFSTGDPDAIREYIKGYSAPSTVDPETHGYNTGNTTYLPVGKNVANPPLTANQEVIPGISTPPTQQSNSKSLLEPMSEQGLRDAAQKIETDLAQDFNEGTGSTYAQWQALVNKGDLKASTIKMRNIESFKERGYWVSADGKKNTTKPTDYDKYYGE
jgi:hypothetical protein